MTGLLVDIHIADGSLFLVSQDPDSLYKYSINRYQYVFAQHKTDSTQFKKSYKYYTNKPDQLFEIYEDVQRIIKAKSDSSIKVRTVADSLERIKQSKITERLAKRATDSINKVKKLKADSVAKKKAKTDSAAKKKAAADSIAKAKKLNKKNALPRK